MAGNSLVGVDFEVFGRVQGVFFRKYTEKKATELGLKGWVMNTPTDTVVGQIEGPKAAVDQMTTWLRTKGSPKSKIDKLELKNERSIPKLVMKNHQSNGDSKLDEANQSNDSSSSDENEGEQVRDISDVSKSMKFTQQKIKAIMQPCLEKGTSIDGKAILAMNKAAELFMFQMVTEACKYHDMPKEKGERARKSGPYVGYEHVRNGAVLAGYDFLRGVLPPKVTFEVAQQLVDSRKRDFELAAKLPAWLLQIQAHNIATHSPKRRRTKSTTPAAASTPASHPPPQPAADSSSSTHTSPATKPAS